MQAGENNILPLFVLYFFVYIPPPPHTHTALESTQSEIFELKNKFDEESSARFLLLHSTFLTIHHLKNVLALQECW